MTLVAVAGVVGSAPARAQTVRVAPAPPAQAPAAPTSGWLGIAVAEVEGPVGPPALVIVGIRPGSPSQAAGLAEGDRITRLNGVAVGLERFRSLTRRLEPGDPVAFGIRRGDEELDVSVVAGLRPSEGILVQERLQQELEAVRSRMVEILRREGDSVPEIMVRVDGGTIRVAPEHVGVIQMRRISPAQAPGEPRAATAETVVMSPLSPFLSGTNRIGGAEFRALTPELGAFFEVDSGLLVTSVAPGTPAAEADLRSGDVVVEAAGRPVATVDELRRRLSVPGERAELTVVRKGQRLPVRFR